MRFHPRGASAGDALFALRPGGTTLGRDDSCDVALPDEEVSRQHAVVRRAGEAWQIEDQGSANGTHVGGRRIKRADLAGGEIIRLGATLFRFLSPGPTHPWRRTSPDSAMVAGPSMGAALDLLDRAADSDLSVLLAGETGTGKEVAARHLHNAGPRRKGPFVALNCGAVPAPLFESELFGHRKGAFTDAKQDSPGHFRRAHGGTLLLDEVGELPPEAQPKLLRVLQDRRVLPVGGSAAVPVDVRVVCATNRDLGSMVERGGFRVDLFARISELVVQLPPLRQRLEDIPSLVDHFVGKHGRGEEWEEVKVEILEALCCRPWPQNIRQLENAVRRALLMAGGSARLLPEHFAEQEETTASSDSAGSRSGVARAPEPEPPQAVHLREALTRHHGVVSACAEELGISVSQVYRRARKYGLKVAHFRQ